MSDLTLVPDFAIDEDVNFQTIVSQFESGHEQRREKWKTPIRKFHIVYKNRTSVDMGIMRDFFLSKRGKAVAFTWTNPNDSVEYTVRFDTDNMKFTRKAFDVYDFSCDLIEVK